MPQCSQIGWFKSEANFLSSRAPVDQLRSPVAHQKSRFVFCLSALRAGTQRFWLRNYDHENPDENLYIPGFSLVFFSPLFLISVMLRFRICGILDLEMGLRFSVDVCALAKKVAWKDNRQRGSAATHSSILMVNRPLKILDW